MQRKTMVLASLVAAAALGGFVMAGVAFGADWHEYTGKVSAGRAYLVPVPEKSDNLDFVLTPTGADAASAKISVFDPKDTKVAFYALDAKTTTGDIVSPAAGGYVFYVYELKNANLAVRLASANTDAAKNLSLTRLTTERVDRPIYTVDNEAPLAHDLTLTIPKEPVFMTLLYDGTVSNLTATVNSEKGSVVDIAGENGVAYSPGLWSSLDGTRTLHPENLAAGTFTIHATADSFEGTLYLTGIDYHRAMDAPVTEAPVPATAPATPGPGETSAMHASPTVGVRAGVPTAITVPANVDSLRISLPPMKQASANDTNSTNASYGSAAVALFGPSDELVKFLKLDDKNSSVTVSDLKDGEYVIFVLSSVGYGSNYDPTQFWGGYYDSSPNAHAISVEAIGGMLKSRELATKTISKSIGHFDAPTGLDEKVTTIPAFATPPLSLAVTKDNGVSLNFNAEWKSPLGVAATQNDFVDTFGMSWLGGSATLDHEKMSAGKYTLSLRADSFEGDLGYAYTTYDRAHTLNEKHNAGDTTQATPPAPPAPPAPPVPPMLNEIASVIGVNLGH
ncbi:MAG: hypothetical protein ACYDCK_11945 [Thermoplasmatota archaeon]